MKINPADIVNFYSRLGLDSNASEEDINKAFRKVVFTWHPDKIGKNPESSRAMIALLRAKETLSDSNKRNAYNLMHGLGSGSNENLSEMEFILKQDINGFGCTHSNYSEKGSKNCDGKPVYLFLYLLRNDFLEETPMAHVDLVCQSFYKARSYNSLWPELLDNYAIELYSATHAQTNPEDLTNIMRQYQGEVFKAVEKKLNQMDKLTFFKKTGWDKGGSLIADWDPFELNQDLRDRLFEQIKTEYKDILRIFTPKLTD